MGAAEIVLLRTRGEAQQGVGGVPTEVFAAGEVDEELGIGSCGFAFLFFVVLEGLEHEGIGVTGGTGGYGVDELPHGEVDAFIEFAHALAGLGLTKGEGGIVTGQTGLEGFAVPGFGGSVGFRCVGVQTMVFLEAVAFLLTVGFEGGFALGDVGFHEEELGLDVPDVGHVLLLLLPAFDLTAIEGFGLGGGEFLTVAPFLFG